MTWNIFKKKKTIEQLKEENKLEKERLTIEKEKIQIEKESLQLQFELDKEKEELKKLIKPHPFVKFVDSVRGAVSNMAPPPEKKSKKGKKNAPNPFKDMAELFRGEQE